MVMKNKAPDMSGANQAAVEQAALSREQLEWAKQIYAETAPEREAASQRSLDISDAQLDLMLQAVNEAGDLYSHTRENFRPIEESIARDAMNFDTEAERERLAGVAQGDVNQAFSAARGTAARDMARTGVNPNDGRAAAVNKELTYGQALAGSAAANKARSDAMTLGRAIKMDAASLGRNIASGQATQASISQNSGSVAASTGMAPLQVTQSGNQIMQNGYNTALRGLEGAGNTFTNIARVKQAAGDNSGMWQGLGSVAGAFIASDVQAKKGIEALDEDAALEAVTATPVSQWEYKEGEGDGGKHVGPMAQDVNATMGEKAAPGGKKIDLISMNGITMAAVKALDKKIARVAAAAGIPA